MRHPRAAHSGLILSVALPVALTVALTGCTAVDAVEDQLGLTDPPPSGVVTGWSLALGDCVDAWNGSLQDGVSVTPCSEPHDWEVYHRVSLDDLAGSGFPGDDLIRAAAEEGCDAQFLPFLGAHGPDPASGAAADATAPYGYTYLSPPEADWRMLDEHVASCLIGDMNGRVHGSLVGAGAPAAG